MPFPDLSAKAPVLRWALLGGSTFALALLLGRLGIPASVFLSAMVSGVLLALSGGSVRIPRPVFMLGQSVVGCMIARSISPATLRDILHNWPLFLLMVLSVTLVANLLGWLLARSGTLPGTTAIWGTSPGAALVMTLMSESYGADPRLVAFMQYTRVMLVSLVASIVSSLWAEPMPPEAVVAAAAATDYAELAKTLALAAVGAFGGRLLRIPSGPIIVPLVLGPLCNLTGVVRIELPWWLLWCAYFMVGWSIGLRFTREIVRHAFRALPRILVTLTTMIALCGGLAVLFARALGLDPLTAYLAASPGGLDSIAIIASSVGGDMSFVIAVQTTRFIVVTLSGPPLATFLVKRLGMYDGDRNP